MLERVLGKWFAGAVGAAFLFFIYLENVFAQVSSSVKLENPLRPGLNSIPALISAILDIVVQIGIPVVALFIIYSGFLFVKAQGNPTELETAKKALVWTLVCAAVLLGASVLSSVISGTIDQLRG